MLEKTRGHSRWRFEADAGLLAAIAACYASTSDAQRRLFCAKANDLLVEEHVAARYLERGGSQWVYGELTIDGCLAMLDALGILSHSRGRDEAATFLDCGSGVGQVVLCAALLGCVTRSIGVELVAARHAVAERALSRLLAALTDSEMVVDDLHSRVELQCSDILVETDRLSEVSHAFIANAVWADELTSEVVTHVMAQAARIRVIATLKAPPAEVLSATGLTHLRTVPVAVSWERDEGWPLYVYSSRQDPACCAAAARGRPQDE